ncbi:DNA methyltransferase [Brevundimonas faecalis]|uniref:Methyltransferase n=1 Tax=Brevundimonas faecalis TaxID=947378 RepID=A0ABV2RAW0_9CAUL
MRRVEVIGSATLYQGDAYETLEELGPQDAGVFDPPYEFATSGGGRFRKARPNMDQIAAAGLDKGFDDRICSPAIFRSVAVFCHNDQLPELLPRLAARFYRTVVCAWHKSNALPVANKHYRPDTEFWIHAWLADAHPVGSLTDKARWILSENGRFTGVDHPTVKPEPVMDKVLATINARRVCDPFMGSGSTGVAAIKRGLGFTGVERDPKHFDTACRRIEAAVKASEIPQPREAVR